MVAMVDSAATAPQTVSEQERNDNMILMQLEALRQGRRDHISTRDFKERKAEYVPLRCITRRVDQAGTEENLAAQGKARKQLTAWNTAYLDLQDDGTAEQALKDVNEGLGQTHRGKLQADESLKTYTPEHDHFFRGGLRGGRGVRGGSGASRGGRFPGNTSIRIERPAPVKRSRVVKGSVSAAPITQKLLKQSNKASALRSAPSMSINRQPSSHSTVSGTKQTSSNVHAQPPTPKPKEVMPREPGKVNVTYAGNLATPDDFMASVRRKQAPLAKTQSVTQPKLEPSSHNDAVTMEEPQGSDLQRKQAPAVETQRKPQGDTPKPFARIEGFLETGPNVAKAKTVKAEKPPGQPDLMDFEPVIGFTHPSDSVTKTEKVLQERVTPTDTTSLQSPTSDDMMLLIQKLKIAEAVGAQGEHQEALQNLIHDLEAPVKAKRAQAATAPMKLTKTSTYSVTDMMALRPKIALPPPKDAVTSSKPLAGRGETTVPASIAAMSPISESSSIHNRAPPRPRPAQGRASMSIPNITTLTTDLGLAREIALQQGANRELLVGEHVHKTHFQRAQLVEKREDVSLADSVPSKLAASRAGPSLPAHLANLAAITDHGAATRSQYDALSDTSSHTSRRGPSLPAHLANQPAVTDAGAAVRAEYDSGPVTSRGRGVLSDYNGQLRSSTLTNSAPAPPTGPKSRSSMLSKTGFIGRAEN